MEDEKFDKSDLVDSLNFYHENMSLAQALADSKDKDELKFVIDLADEALYAIVGWDVAYMNKIENPTKIKDILDALHPDFVNMSHTAYNLIYNMGMRLARDFNSPIGIKYAFKAAERLGDKELIEESGRMYYDALMEVDNVYRWEEAQTIAEFTLWDRELTEEAGRKIAKRWVDRAIEKPGYVSTALTHVAEVYGVPGVMKTINELGLDTSKVDQDMIRVGLKARELREERFE